MFGIVESRETEGKCIAGVSSIWVEKRVLPSYCSLRLALFCVVWRGSTGVSFFRKWSLDSRKF